MADIRQRLGRIAFDPASLIFFVFGAVAPAAVEIVEILNSKAKAGAALDDIHHLYIEADLLFICTALSLIAISQLRHINQTAKRHEHEASEADKHIAELFRTLESYHSRFDTEVLNAFTLLSDSSSKIKSEDLQSMSDSITKFFIELLENICNTAVEALAAKKNSEAELLSANIKGVVLFGSVNCYKVICRGASRRTSRRSFDGYINSNPAEHEVAKHWIYDYLRAGDLANEYVSDDIQAVIDRVAHDEFKRWTHPNSKVAELYASSITVPIIGPKSLLYRDLRLPNDESYEPQGDDIILGYFCIDSQEKNYFNKHYDVIVLNQLAAQAFNVLRAYNAATGLIERRRIQATARRARTVANGR